MIISPASPFPLSAQAVRGLTTFVTACLELQEPFSFGISETTTVMDWLRAANLECRQLRPKHPLHAQEPLASATGLCVHTQTCMDM